MSKAEQEYYNMNPRNNYGYWNYEPIRSKRQGIAIHLNYFYYLKINMCFLNNL